MEIPDGYEMHLAAPSAGDFAMLRREAGLSPVTPEQAAIAIAGGWAAAHVTHQGAAVGMGRLIGDGGWMFQVTDMAVHPQHQRQGLRQDDSVGAFDGHPRGRYGRLASCRKPLICLLR